VSDLARNRTAATLASLALLVFAGCSAVPLAAWLQRAADPFSWKAGVTASAMLGTIWASAIVWRRESRLAAVAGIIMMWASLTRIGPPEQWTAYSFLLIAGTLVLSMPVVHAALALR
jgi:hypothetical protein